MKKILFLLSALAAMAFSACSEADYGVTEPKDAPVSYKISAEEAAASVQDFLAAIDAANPGAAKSRSGKAREIEELIAVGHKRRASRSEEPKDTSLFIINFRDSAGFIIMSADRRREPIYAFVEEGRYEVPQYDGLSIGDTIPLRQKFEIDLGDPTFWGEDLSGGNENNSKILFTTEHGWKVYVYVRPIIKTKWGQRGVYGKYCPNGTAGCVMTATAQILSHFKTPNHIDWTYNGEKHSTDIDWERIMADCEANNGKLNESNTQSSDEIAHLCRAIGIDINAVYEMSYPYSTGAITNDAAIWLRNKTKLKSNNLKRYEEDAVIKAIKEGNPILTRGSDSPISGHAWVCDGYIKATMNGYFSRLIHCNWGWDGQYNGYFISDVFDIFKNEIKDDDPNLSRSIGKDMSNDAGSNAFYDVTYSIISR